MPGKCFIILTVSLLLMSGCGKSKETEVEKKDITASPVPEGKRNLAINPSFEDGTTFKGALGIRQKPLGWRTKNQFLNDSNGWASDEAHSGDRSLKIENIGGTSAYWEGAPVIFKDPVNALEISIWTKTKEINNETQKGKFRIELVIFPEDANSRETETIRIYITKENHNWEKTERKIFFKKDISKLVPYICFSNASGFIDDLFLHAYNTKSVEGKILFDSNKNKFSGKINNVSKSSPDIIYTVKGARIIQSADFLPVKTDKIYELSGAFRSADKESAKFYFGYIPYTGAKVFIPGQAVNYVSETETELVKACASKDTVIYVKNAAHWVISKISCVAFNIDSSGGKSDLPNFNLSGLGIDKIKKSDNSCEISLSEPVGRNFPAGTKVREHVNSWTYIYNAASESMVGTEWMNFSGLIGSSDSKCIIDKFYPETKYVKMVIFADERTPAAALQFKNIKLREIQE